MKKLILLLFSALTLGAAVHAQDSTTTHHKHDNGSAIKQQRADEMQQLNLTKEQKTKLEKLHEEQKVRIDSIHNSSMSDDEKKTQMRNLRENGHQSMEDVLTPEQKIKWQQMHTRKKGNAMSPRQSADSTQ